MKRHIITPLVVLSSAAMLLLSGCGQSADSGGSTSSDASGAASASTASSASGGASRSTGGGSVSAIEEAPESTVAEAVSSETEAPGSTAPESVPSEVEAPESTASETVLSESRELPAEDTGSAASGSASAVLPLPDSVPEVPESLPEAPAVTAAPTEKPAPDIVTSEKVAMNPFWEYADRSKINTGVATLYHTRPSIAKHKTVCVNAGHGTKNVGDIRTLCHPDGSPKVTGGTTGEGAIEAIAVSSGTDFLDGTPEAEVTLALALVVRDTLLEDGYDVLMIRETDDVQLDNIARTVMANNLADCHIALHYDGTQSDKGVFFMSVPSDPSYRSMQPVASHWMDHNRLGEAVVKGIEAQGFSLFDGGSMEMDLTQTSYSTVPSIDLEVGDAASDHSGATFPALAKGIADGLDSFFLFTVPAADSASVSEAVQ